VKHPEVIISPLRGFEMDSKGSHNQSMVSTTELGTPIHPAILEDPPTSANEYVVDLLGCITSIAVPCPAMWVWALVPGARNPQFLGPSKILEKEAFLTTGISSCAMGTDRHLIASSITARYRIEVTQDNTNISPGAPV
jgi:hypothetical protein